MASSMTGGADDPRPYYGRARIAAGSGLIVLVAVLFVFDFVSPDFHFDSIQLGLLLGTAMLFLGVEAGRKLLG